MVHAEPTLTQASAATAGAQHAFPDWLLTTLKQGVGGGGIENQ
jgi:hypothetical protein